MNKHFINVRNRSQNATCPTVFWGPIRNRYYRIRLAGTAGGDQTKTRIQNKQSFTSNWRPEKILSSTIDDVSMAANAHTARAFAREPSTSMDGYSKSPITTFIRVERCVDISSLFLSRSLSLSYSLSLHNSFWPRVNLCQLNYNEAVERVKKKTLLTPRNDDPIFVCNWKWHHHLLLRPHKMEFSVLTCECAHTHTSARCSAVDYMAANWQFRCFAGSKCVVYNVYIFIIYIFVFIGCGRVPKPSSPSSLHCTHVLRRGSSIAVICVNLHSARSFSGCTSIGRLYTLFIRQRLEKHLRVHHAETLAWAFIIIYNYHHSTAHTHTQRSHVHNSIIFFCHCLLLRRRRKTRSDKWYVDK